jgi:hypothetical protein
MCGFFDGAFTPQVVVERMQHLAFIEIEQHVNTRGGNIRVHHANAQTFHRQKRRQICGCVGFSSAAAEGMNGNDFGHADSPILIVSGAYYKTVTQRASICEGAASHPSAVRIEDYYVIFAAMVAENRTPATRFLSHQRLSHRKRFHVIPVSRQ